MNSAPSKQSILSPLRWIHALNFQQATPSVQPHVDFSLQQNGFVIKIANTTKEVQSVFQLRYQVFLQEVCGQKNNIGMEFDRYDLDSDHLVVIHQKSKQVIGCYRIRSTLFTNDFYTDSQFDLSPILELPGRKVELGRACIHPNFRNGHTLQLLWKGIMEYVRKTNIQTLFGCSSIMTTDLNQLADAYRYLGKKNAFLRTSVSTRPAYQTEGSFSRLQALSVGLSPLMKFYLSVGAHFGVEAALDRAMGCYDFFTLLDLSKMRDRYKRRYGQN